ncbi:hypothetical protein IQ235_03665 [Oscillatoriales cyanobacterium LEGE 11467]|uniref:Uncharacterized protein n=1 Tax=Zarconia navalis LEGE 11467 TaxID=1828826 RepID=A0A928VV69_9CYAN|nr:hypothetical protein [Zarconia navalis]MBE9039888.1 hypothetical protein [Zarconia navalis LEGE 11467]
MQDAQITQQCGDILEAVRLDESLTVWHDLESVNIGMRYRLSSFELTTGGTIAGWRDRPIPIYDQCNIHFFALRNHHV